MTPGAGMPLVGEKCGEFTRRVLIGSHSLDIYPVVIDNLVSLRRSSIRKLRMRGKRVEIQMRPGDVVASFQAAEGVSQLIVIVDVAPKERRGRQFGLFSPGKGCLLECR